MGSESWCFFGELWGCFAIQDIAEGPDCRFQRQERRRKVGTEAVLPREILMSDPPTHLGLL